MKKFLATVLSLVFAFSLVACGGPGKEVTREELIGQWIVVQSDQTQYITLEADGTYISHIEASMGFDYDTTNRWSYEDGVYTVYYDDLNTTSVYKKVSLDGNTLYLDNGVATLTYTRYGN